MNTTEAAKILADKLASLNFHPRNQKSRHERLSKELQEALVAFKNAPADTVTERARASEEPTQ
jgi:hypothetical protein